MSSVVKVSIHPSQSPKSVQRDLLGSLLERRINHKFHYDSYKQSQKWLALHDAYSPSRNDSDCLTAYTHAFENISRRLQSSIHLIGLGCGGGQKDVRLIEVLAEQGIAAEYTPCDVSLPLVLTATEEAARLLPQSACHPLVCDLLSAEDLPQVFEKQADPKFPRLLTFFGMIPNFEPSQIVPKLSALVRPQDWLLFSANLAPGKDYETGVRQILPGYDNQMTRDWLMTFLVDLGVDLADGETIFRIENADEGLKRIIAEFHFKTKRELNIYSEPFGFKPGETIRLFFSYRYTPALVKTVLAKHNLAVLEQWITQSEEEGVFLCRRI